MIRLIFTVFSLAGTIMAHAQVGIGTTTPNASAQLQAESRNKGFLPPRIALTGATEVATIASPATGLLIYNTAAAGTSPNAITAGFYYYDGAKLQRLINQQPDATIEFDQLTPTTAGVVFNPNTPSCKDYIYVSTVDGSQWSYNGTTYVTYSAPASTPWYLVGGTNDAGSNKSGNIYRTGNIGLGSSNFTPATKIDIRTSTNGGGLRLQDGTQGSGKILASDINGNASWQTGSVVLYTEMHSSGGVSTTFNTGSTITIYNITLADNVKKLYGSSYAWDATNNYWKAPKNGKYRITTNVFFNDLSGSKNPHVYAYLNGSAVCNLTAASMAGTGTGSDAIANTSAIIAMNQGDYTIWKVPAWQNVKLYTGNYHNFVRIESVE